MQVKRIMAILLGLSLATLSIASIQDQSMLLQLKQIQLQLQEQSQSLTQEAQKSQTNCNFDDTAVTVAAAGAKNAVIAGMVGGAVLSSGSAQCNKLKQVQDALNDNHIKQAKVAVAIQQIELQQTREQLHQGGNE